MRLQLLAAAALACATAFAAPVVTLSYTNGSSAAARQTALNAWTSFETSLNLAGLDVAYEDFEDGSWTSGSETFASGGVSKGPNVATRWYDASVSTSFGSWNANGTAGLGDSSRTKELVVLKSGNSPFGGRINTTPGGQFWLDSNDVTSVIFTPASPIFALGFLISDATDQGATFNVTFASGAYLPVTQTLNPSKGNGTLAFMSIMSDASNPITSVQFFNTGSNTRADGFGMDDFISGAAQLRQTSPVPEPGTYALVGAALIGLAWLRRRK